LDIIHFFITQAEVLSAISYVDYIVFFDDPTPFRIINLIKPDVLVKGSDWRVKDIVGYDIVKKNGGRVVRVSLKKGLSTTGIIDTILKRYSKS